MYLCKNLFLIFIYFFIYFLFYLSFYKSMVEDGGCKQAELYEVRQVVDEEGNTQNEIFLCVNKGQTDERIFPLASAPNKYLFLL